MERKLYQLMEEVRDRIDPARVGMIVCHNGIVRGTSRDGQIAEYLDIDCDGEAWDRILDEYRRRPGISAVEAHLFTGRRQVGDDVLLVVVAGDIRENVFPVLEEVVNRLKAEAVVKREKLGGK